MEVKHPLYMLRRSLFPWKPQETIDEAVRYARDCRIDEIIWKIDTEEFSHGLPTLDVVRSYLPWLSRAREALAQVGVSMAINPWTSQGMRDAGWDLRQTFPDFEWMTDITGIQAKSQACPMSPAWQEWICQAYELYASTGPRVLWIEDDFRVHRHRPVMTACFCKRHIDSFNQKMGTSFTRETLAEEILRPGEPSPVRGAWMEHVGGNMCHVLELLAGRVHSKYPQVQLGLMLNHPRMTATERRDWDRAMRAIKGHHAEAVVRPSMGNYSEWTMRGLYDSHDTVAYSLACNKVPLHACSEVENYPYTRYSKSIRMSRAQVLLSAVMRCPSMTFNLYDHCGTPIDEEPQYLQMLRDIRPMVETLVEAYGSEGIERGVGILHDEQMPKHTRLMPGQGMFDTAIGTDYLAGMAEAMGMSLTFHDSPVVSVTGQRLRVYSKLQLEKIFSGGVLIDLAGLETLKDLGIIDLAGVEIKGTFWRRERTTAMEAMTDTEFGGGEQRYVSLDHVGLTAKFAEIVPQTGARVISQMIDGPTQRPLLPAVTVFENRLGGRVAVYPYDLTREYPAWFPSWKRQRQMRAVINWLFRGQLPLAVDGGVYPLAIRTDYPDRVMVSVTNLSSDAWPKVVMTLAMDRAVKSVARLGLHGRWEQLPEQAIQSSQGQVVITSDRPLEYGDMAVFRVGY